MAKMKTHEEFVKQIKDKYKDKYKILSNYAGAKTKILVQHNCEKCNNYQWMITPNKLLSKGGCPKCAGNIQKTHEEFVKQINEKYKDEYKILGTYKNANTKILVKHNSDKCNYHEWEVKPSSLLSDHQCPVCSGREAKLGINTIFDTDKWMIDLGVPEEIAKKFSSRSSKNINVKCPDCGTEKSVRLSHIYYNKTIFCSCGDGKSYPEKFIMNVLNQLNVEYIPEYISDWAANKRYDFYIPSLDIIIEAHGQQHYNGIFKSVGGRGLEEEQENDRYKREIACKNGIKHYIIIDCRESNLEWIRNSILNSELSKIFNLTDINWLECSKFATKNLIKQICDYWNNKNENETTKDLSEIFKLNRRTIVTYLHDGTQLGWCKYNSKEESMKSGLRSGKKVMILKDGTSLGIFNSCAELERQSEKSFGIRLSRSSISNVCTGKRKTHKGYEFKYIDDNI